MIQLKQLQGWQGKICINGTEYESVDFVPDTLDLEGATIDLIPKAEKRRVRVEDI